jgi:iron complex outermembrane receptor protein
MTNTTTYDISSNLQIKNIIGITNTIARDGGKLDGSPYDLLDDGPSPGISRGNIFNTQQWSEEFQVLGKALDGDLTYIVGFYADSNTEKDNYPLSTLQDIGPTLALALGASPAQFFHYNFISHDHSKGIFFQDTYNLSALTGVQGLSLTTGFRYTWEDLNLHQGGQSVFLPTFGAAPESTTESNPSWNVSLEYQLNSDTLFYVAQRGSWRTGNFNGTSFPSPTDASKFGNLFLPETTEDVEAGAKFQGRVLGRPARLNVDVYNQWVDNVQRAVYAVLAGNPAGFTVNVPSAQTTGFEVEADLKPTDWLEVGANGAYTDSRFTNGRVSLFGLNESFGPYADAPRWTGSLYAQVSAPVPDNWGSMTARTDVYGQSGQFISNLNNTTDPGSFLPGYALVNLRFDWRRIMGSQVSAGVFIKNVLDKQTYVGGMPLGGALGLNTAIPGEPRTFGFELSYKFGGL